MKDSKILVQVVEDDPAMARFVRRNLELAAFRVVVSRDGQTALDQFEDKMPDLVILDIGLPALNGLEVCRHLRTTSDVPVIMVTSRDRDDDIIEGLEAGADDYLGKPFSAGVLLARVNAVLRRRMPRFEPPTDLFDRGGLIVDFSRRSVIAGSAAVHLTPTEYRLLTILVRHSGKVLTSRQILTEVWGPEYCAEFQILRTHVGRLRRKIEPDSARPTFIHTEPGVGYWLKG